MSHRVDIDPKCEQFFFFSFNFKFALKLNLSFEFIYFVFWITCRRSLDYFFTVFLSRDNECFACNFAGFEQQQQHENEYDNFSRTENHVVAAFASNKIIYNFDSRLARIKSNGVATWYQRFTELNVGAASIGSYTNKLELLDAVTQPISIAVICIFCRLRDLINFNWIIV